MAGRRASLSRIPPLPPTLLPLTEAIRNRESKKDDYKAWLQWLNDDDIPSCTKCDKLHELDDEKGFSALHYATQEYCTDILSVALMVDGDFDVKTRERELTPLLVAASYSRKNAVLWLLQDAREEITEGAVDTDGRNAIHLACLDLQCQYTIEPLVRQLGEDLCPMTDKDGNTPLHLAAAKGNMQAIDNGLLSAEIWENEEDEEEQDEGQDCSSKRKEMICKRNEDHQTTLHLAASSSSVEVVKALKDLCPEALFMVDHNGDLPLNIAIEKGSKEVLQSLLQWTFEKEENVLEQRVYDELVKSSNQVLVILHLGKEVCSMATAIRDLCESRRRQLVTENSPELRTKAQEAKNSDLKGILPSGVAFLHHGMSKEDQTLVKKLFEDKHIRVLVCTTSALTSDFNPSDCVVIKQALDLILEQSKAAESECFKQGSETSTEGSEASTEEGSELLLHLAIKRDYQGPFDVIFKSLSTKYEQLQKEADEWKEKKLISEKTHGTLTELFKQQKMEEAKLLLTGRNRDGTSMIEYAVYSGQKGGQHVEQWAQLCRDSSIDVVQEFCHVNDCGYTPMMLACKEGSSEVVSAIMKETIKVTQEGIRKVLSISLIFEVLVRTVYDEVMKNAGKKQVLVYFHSGEDTSRMAIGIRNLCRKHNSQRKLLGENLSSQQELENRAKQAVASDLKDILPSGVAFLHDKLSEGDQTLVKELFRDEHIQVLVCATGLTSVLDIPRNCVVINKELQYSPMMLACKEGHVQVVQIILDNLGRLPSLGLLGKLYKETDEERNMNCLEMAIEGGMPGHSHIARMIIESEYWRESLRNLSSDHKGRETTPFRRLIRRIPDVAHRVMERCSEKKEEEKLSLEFVEDFDYSPALRDETDGGVRGEVADERNWGPKCCERKNHVLTLMVDLKQKDLLKHDVIVRHLNRKWNNYGVWLYLINLFLYVLYLSFLTTFTLKLPNPQSTTCIMRKGNETEMNNKTGNTCDMSTDTRNLLYFAAAVTLLMSFIRLCMEFAQFIGWNIDNGTMKPRLRKAYFKEWTNWVEVPLFIASFIFVAMVVGNRCVCPNIGQWQLGTVVIFIAWIDLLTFLEKFPKLGVYLLMMQHILYNFIEVLVIALFFSLAFGFAFYMTFHDPNVPASPFEDTRLAVMKIFSMTAGGPDDSIFRFSNMGSAELDQVAYPELAYFVWVIFIVIMAVLFLNFLIGLAVEDVSKLQQHARYEILRLKVKHVLAMDELFFPITRKGCGVCKRGYHLPRRDELLEKVDKTSLPEIFKGLFSAIIKLVSYFLNKFLLWGTEDSDLTVEEEGTDYMVKELLRGIKEQDSTIAELMKKLDDQEMIIREQGGMIREQREMMKKIDDQQKAIGKQGEVIKRYEETLEQYTKERLKAVLAYV